MTEAVRVVRLYGQLGSRFGRVHRLAVCSPAEAIRALCAMVRGFEAYLMGAKDRGYGFGVLVGKRHLGEEELHYPSGADEIRIAPVLLGSKSGGLFQIIFGAILIVAGVLLSGVTGGVSLYLVQAGIAMVAGGVIQLLSPHPHGNSAKDKSQNTPNYSFNGIVNTEAQGNPVPVVWGGPLKVGSSVISAGIYANDGAYVPTAAAASGGIVAVGALGGGGGGTPGAKGSLSA